MDKQQNNLPKDFFKQFKSKADFQSFFSELYKQGVEENSEIIKKLWSKKKTTNEQELNPENGQ